jgi:DNA-binding NtrC family response regulator
MTAPPQRILVIDDEAVVCHSARRSLAPLGHEVTTRVSSQEGLELALSGDFDIVLLDLMMPEPDGLAIFRRLRQAGVGSEVVVITGYADVGTAVEVMKLGAADYLCKPFSPDELRVVVGKVAERSALLRENAALREELARSHGFQGMIGESPAMERVYGLIRRVAPSDGTVLITGESGTGKEMVARAVHDLSSRAAGPFVACDCSALASTLLESELFGHVKGSFSGAIGTKPGLFEAASGGTLFLDEVANIGMETQGKLLRVLESRRVKRVGDTGERAVDIRLVAATNRDLEGLIADGSFREDLFYRLNVVPILLPPLRERGEDIPRLTAAFLGRFRSRGPTAVRGFSPRAMALLEAYAWPGNVRELKNIVERMAILCDAERVEPHHLPAALRGASPEPGPGVPQSWEEAKERKQALLDAAAREFETRFLLEALERAGWNVSEAARAVGMQRSNFHALMRKHGIGRGDQGEA